MSDESATQNLHTLPRRDFFARAFAILIGGVAGIIPVVASLLVLFDPLRKRKKTGGGPIRVASLQAVPDDGQPHKFPVIASRTDAWNKFPEVPIGAVYLRRTGKKTVHALNVVCPHAGCFVDFIPAKVCFFCPCHNSAFALDGKIRDPKSPSPRALDSLPVEIRGEEIYVTFQNFRAGIAKKIPA